MRQLAPTELKSWLDDETRDPPDILDVRQPWEHALCALAGSVAVPLAELPARAGDLNAERDWVVVCHHGVRSLHAASFLERLGFPRVFNLQGGIDAWARDVDPAIARY
ncbi:MAG: sulfurtransferase [Betaproteobacteria bacterium]|nr:sulfurtransferase [Betaproteobacteria bacterium]